MSHATPGNDRSIHAVSALLRLRETEESRSRVKVHRKQTEMARIRQGLEGMRKRREAVLRRGGAHVLRERLLLDALMKITLERGRELEALQSEAAALLEDYREAKGRRDAVLRLRDRRCAEREERILRRAEEAAGDVAAARITREREKPEEGPCVE